MSDNLKLYKDLFYDYDLNDGFKINTSSENIQSIPGNMLELFFMNTLTCEKTIIKLRNIIRRIFKQVYPDLNLLGDKLF